MKIVQQSTERVGVQTPDGTYTISYSISFNDTGRRPTAITIDGAAITAHFDGFGTITDHCTCTASLVTVKRRWHLHQGGRYRLQSSFGWEDGGRESRLFIPAVWYEENRKGKGVFPSWERANTWSFLETRMSIPCCGQLSNGERLFTCATEVAGEQRFLASLTTDRSGFIISIPGSEWPFSYRGKRSLVDTAGTPLPSLHVDEGGIVYERTFFLSIQKERDALAGYSAFVARLPSLPPREGNTLGWDLWLEYKLTRLLNLTKRSNEGLAYLIMGEGNGEVQAVYNFTSASFLVKSLQAAYEMATLTTYHATSEPLKAARRRLASLFDLPDDDLLLATVAKKIGDFFLQAERQPGFFLDNHDLESGAWGGYLGIGEHPEFKEMANSRCNGEAMKHYVLLHRELTKLGIEEHAYLPLARRVARFYCEAQLSGGSFGRWWTAKGKPGDIQGTNGAYIGSFFCTLIKVLDSDDPFKAELESALHRAYSHYGQLASEGAFYGDTLDADSCDKEAGVALLAFFLDLYEMEGDARHLESAAHSAHFIVQWIWQQDSFLKAGSPLAQAGFSTRGMTSVSVAHHHLDFYGMAIAYEFLRYSAYTGDRFFEEQARLMIEACRQLVATPEQHRGRDDSFVGWQPEQLNHTNWEYFNRPSLMDGHYDIDIAWVTVLTLGSFLLIRDTFAEGGTL